MAGQMELNNAIAGANTIATAASHESLLESATFKNFDETNAASDAGMITVGISAPSGTSVAGVTMPWSGMGWHDTNPVTNGPLEQTKFYDGGATTWVAAIGGFAGPSAPSLTEPGRLWYDTTLFLWRRYESDTTAPNGVAGWHPLSDAYQLWKNESGGDVAANKVVIFYQGGTTDLRRFTTTTVAKDQAVLGVTLESIANGSYGVIAPVSGGAQVTILADDGEADGAIVKGDFLGSFTTAGECRTIGPQTSSAIVAAGNHTVGTPMGAFAIALGVKDGSHLVKAKLLGFVGSGAMALLKRVSIVSDTVPETANTELDASKISSLSSGAQGTQTAAISNKHLPFAAVRFDWVYSAVMAAGGSSGTLSLFSDGGTTPNALRLQGGQGAGDVLLNTVDTGFIPTHAAGATTTQGNIFSYKYAEVNISSVSTFQLLLTSYIY